MLTNSLSRKAMSFGAKQASSAVCLLLTHVTITVSIKHPFPLACKVLIQDQVLHMLKPILAFSYPEMAIDYASQPVPSIRDWEELWNAWDTVTQAMVPNDGLLEKPIQLRNNLIFYLGHLPTFAGTDDHRTASAFADRIRYSYDQSHWETKHRTSILYLHF